MIVSCIICGRWSGPMHGDGLVQDIVCDCCIDAETNNEGVYNEDE